MRLGSGENYWVVENLGENFIGLSIGWVIIYMGLNFRFFFISSFRGFVVRI